MDKEESSRLLFKAACAGNVADAQAAIDAGADVNEGDKNGNTPLHHAACLTRLDVARLLIERGADASAKNKSQFTPLDLAKAMDVADLLDISAKQQQGHAARVTAERKDKGPPQVGD